MNFIQSVALGSSVQQVSGTVLDRVYLAKLQKATIRIALTTTEYMRGSGCVLERRRPHPYRTGLFQDDKPPILRPRFTHVVGQFACAQAGDHISTGLYKSCLHEHVMARGFVEDLKRVRQGL